MPKSQWDTNQVRQLFVEYQATGRTEIRDRLMEIHKNLVVYIANKFTGRGEPFDDLCQVGLLGLVKAIERFDLSNGAQFGTYATPTIMGEIRRYFRDHGSALKVSRALQELKAAVSKAIREVVAETGVAPTAAALAARLGVTEERVLEAQEAIHSHRVASLDAETHESGETLGQRAGSEDRGLVEVDDRMMVQQAFQSLDERERLIIYGRFYEHQSQSEIARRIGVSQMQVCRLERAALKKMREVLDMAAA